MLKYFKKQVKKKYAHTAKKLCFSAQTMIKPQKPSFFHFLACFSHKKLHSKASKKHSLEVSIR